MTKNMLCQIYTYQVDSDWKKIVFKFISAVWKVLMPLNKICYCVSTFFLTCKHFEHSTGVLWYIDATISRNVDSFTCDIFLYPTRQINRFIIKPLWWLLRFATVILINTVLNWLGLKRHMFFLSSDLKWVS